MARRDGVLTALCPMTYTPDNELFRQQVEVGERARGRRPTGLGGDRGATGSTSPGIVEKIALARQSGARGVVLFSHESLERPPTCGACATRPSRSTLALGAEPRPGGHAAGSR